MFLVRRSHVLRLCFHLPLRLVVWRPLMGGGFLRVKHPGGVLQGKEIKDEGAQTQNRITDARLHYKLKIQPTACCTFFFPDTFWQRRFFFQIHT